MAKPLPIATNPDNPLAAHLNAIRETDEPRWRYERSRLRIGLDLSRSHFQRVVDGFGCSLDVALHLHELTAGAVDPKLMLPTAPWERLAKFYDRA